MSRGDSLRTLALLVSFSAAAAVDPVYASLWLYQGTWHVNRKDLAPGAKPDELRNQCALVGRYFVCEQTVNGQTGNLLIFIPAKAAGHYHTQNVGPQGRAGAVGDLEISGDRWIYSSRWDQGGGKAIYYRTTNLFTGKNRIHYEQAESANGTDWKVTSSGDEVRVAGAGRQ
jgi:hypothetical protein